MESARPAVASDLDAINALWAGAAEELSHERGGPLLLTREAAGIDVAQRMSSEHSTVVAGLYDEAVVGFAIARVEPLRDGSKLAVVEALYVEPDARAVGVGEALIDVVEQWATARGCAGLDSIVLPGMRDSKNFFEAHGLTARAIVVHRDL
jgi:GNAT superfamily N-acetyltransferase